MCGKVRFEFVGAPLLIAHCHRASCRRNTGATFVGVRRDGKQPPARPAIAGPV